MFIHDFAIATNNFNICNLKFCSTFRWYCIKAVVIKQLSIGICADAIELDAAVDSADGTGESCNGVVEEEYFKERINIHVALLDGEHAWLSDNTSVYIRYS